MRGMGLRQQDVDGVLSEVFCFEKKGPCQSLGGIDWRVDIHYRGY